MNVETFILLILKSLISLSLLRSKAGQNFLAYWYCQSNLSHCLYILGFKINCIAILKCVLFSFSTFVIKQIKFSEKTSSFEDVISCLINILLLFALQCSILRDFLRLTYACSNNVNIALQMATFDSSPRQYFSVLNGYVFRVSIRKQAGPYKVFFQFQSLLIVGNVRRNT